MSSTCKRAIRESNHGNAIFRQFQDAIFSREHTSTKTLTKRIFDLLHWQEITTLSLPKKAAIFSFIWTTFRGHFCLGANDITRNRSRVIFSRSMRRHFSPVKLKPNLVPRVLSLSNMAAAGEKTLAHSELKRSLIGAFHSAFIRALSLVYSFQNKDG